MTTEPTLDSELADLVAAAGPATDVERSPSAVVLRAFARRGLLRLVVPRSYGGAGLGPVQFMTFLRSLASVHGSTAWTVMTCNEEAGITSAHLDPAAVTALFADHPDVVIAGSGIPRGVATATAGGWTVSGRWGFVSGAAAADRVVVVSKVEGSTPLRLQASLVPIEQVTIHDTWDTAGLRGTGSHDVDLAEVEVPDRWGAEFANFALPRPDDPFYRLPAGLRFPFPKVGVAAGIARAALDEFAALAAGKRPALSRTLLAERPSAQMAAAEAEARLESGWAWAMAMAEELWNVATAGGSVSPELHARCRLAASHAVAAAVAAVDTVCAEAGTTANLSASPLSRLQADVRAVSGHFMVAPYQQATAGRVLLGLEPADPQF